MLKLEDSLTYRGAPFLGAYPLAASEITVSPNADPTDLRWLWQFSPHEKPLEISPSVLSSGKRRIRLVYHKHALEIFEHLGALRHHVLGVTIRSTKWGPFCGSAETYLNLFERASVEYPEDQVPWYTVSQTVRHSYESNRGSDSLAYTEIRPSREKKLRVTVTCSYEGLGSDTKTFDFSRDNVAELVYRAPTQGWPRSNYLLSRLATKLGWPHHAQVIWPQEHSPDETLDLFIRHRALDILGALSFLCKDGLFAANVVSNCSGHEADVEVVRRAYPLLRQLRPPYPMLRSL